jgi:hypothetical protein
MRGIESLVYGLSSLCLQYIQYMLQRSRYDFLFSIVDLIPVILVRGRFPQYEFNLDRLFIGDLKNGMSLS